MTSNEKIVGAATELLNGTLRAPDKSGLCLKLVRLVVERAFDWPSHKFYQYRTDIVERHAKDNKEPWARDMERSLANQGFAIISPEAGDRYVSYTRVLSEAEPGDLLFRWDTARSKHGTFIGHVGILLHHGLVLENINPAFRQTSLTRGVTALTPIKDFPVTRVIRFDPER